MEASTMLRHCLVSQSQVQSHPGLYQSRDCGQANATLTVLVKSYTQSLHLSRMFLVLLGVPGVDNDGCEHCCGIFNSILSPFSPSPSFLSHHIYAGAATLWVSMAKDGYE